MTIHTDDIQRVRVMARAYYDKRKNDRERRGEHPSHLASEAINYASKQLNIGYGAEGFCWDCGKEGVTYLNTGDTYDITVLFHSTSRRFTLGSWGDTVEALEKRGITVD